MTSGGTRVGTIDQVDDERTTVDRSDDDGLTDNIKDMLGWDDDSNEINHEHVDRRENDRIYLRER